ncbi:unnamed protein product [Gongylonema pulchrum]|uniref:Uncharacterized protein n=1 Tax=Gongylonema pulchrum TaxID=637853 RepID=A0A183CZW6_9BILA|nr:unnamed protein product [Gongylonema pulchrum]
MDEKQSTQLPVQWHSFREFDLDCRYFRKITDALKELDYKVSEKLDQISIRVDGLSKSFRSWQSINNPSRPNFPQHNYPLCPQVYEAFSHASPPPTYDLSHNAAYRPPLPPPYSVPPPSFYR